MTKKVQKALVCTLYCMFLFFKCEEINLKAVMMLLFFPFFLFLAEFSICPGYLVVDMRSKLIFFYIHFC